MSEPATKDFYYGWLFGMCPDGCGRPWGAPLFFRPRVACLIGLSIGSRPFPNDGPWFMAVFVAALHRYRGHAALSDSRPFSCRLRPL